MTDRPENDARVHHDPTRDINLPPLSDRPPSALPRAWAELRPAAPASEAPDFSSPPPRLDDAVEPVPDPIVADEPTDRLNPPPRPRERTLAFSSPEMGRRPVGQVAVGRTSRRWPWVVMTLLPIMIIVGAGVAWLVLLRTM